MLVVSDTSPVTALLQIGQAGLLPTLFGRVLIPPAVKDELMRFHSSLLLRMAGFQTPIDGWFSLRLHVGC